MKTRKDYIFYIFNVIVLSLISFISFKGMVIATLSYLITCEIIKNR